MADQIVGVVGVLWYQDMSRVCPGCPQTNPGEAGEGSRIRDAYGEHPTSNTEHPTYSEAKLPKATSKPVDSQAIGTPKPPQCDPKVTLKLLQCDPKAPLKPGVIRDP